MGSSFQCGRQYSSVEYLQFWGCKETNSKKDSTVPVCLPSMTFSASELWVSFRFVLGNVREHKLARFARVHCVLVALQGLPLAKSGLALITRVVSLVSVSFLVFFEIPFGATFFPTSFEGAFPRFTRTTNSVNLLQCKRTKSVLYQNRAIEHAQSAVCNALQVPSATPFPPSLICFVIFRPLSGGHELLSTQDTSCTPHLPIVDVRAKNEL